MALLGCAADIGDCTLRFVRQVESENGDPCKLAMFVKGFSSVEHLFRHLVAVKNSFKKACVDVSALFSVSYYFKVEEFTSLMTRLFIDGRIWGHDNQDTWVAHILHKLRKTKAS